MEERTAIADAVAGMILAGAAQQAARQQCVERIAAALERIAAALERSPAAPQDVSACSHQAAPAVEPEPAAVVEEEQPAAEPAPEPVPEPAPEPAPAPEAELAAAKIEPAEAPAAPLEPIDPQRKIALHNRLLAFCQRDPAVNVGKVKALMAPYGVRKIPLVPDADFLELEREALALMGESDAGA